MDLYHLESFLAVADSLHFGHAAEHLNLSQPALSRQIQQLERELGVTLFERSSRGIRLTASGQTLVVHARRVMDEIRAIRHALRQPTSTLQGRVLVGCFDSATAHVMPALLAVLHQIHPQLTVSVTTLGTDQALQFLRHRDIDGAIVTLPVPTEGVRVRPLYREELVAVLPPGHPLTKRRRLSVGALGGEPLITFRSFQNTRRLIDQAFAAAGATPAVVVEAESVETIKGAVRAGLGVAIVGALGMVERPQAGLTVRPIQPPIYRSIGMITAVDYSDDSTVAELARVVGEYVRTIPGASTEESSGELPVITVEGLICHKEDPSASPPMAKRRNGTAAPHPGPAATI